MGYLFTFGYLFAAITAIIAIYILAPKNVRDYVNAIIDEIGGEA